MLDSNHSFQKLFGDGFGEEFHLLLIEGWRLTIYI